MTIEPHRIPGSSLWILREAEFKWLMDNAGDYCDCEPQFLDDPATGSRFVVLTEDDWSMLECEQPSEEQLFFLKMPQKEVKARAVVYDGGITVLAGSNVGKEVKSLQADYREERQYLIDMGVISESKSGLLEFRKSWPFKNPSRAARIVTGDSKSGNDMWKDRHDRSLPDRGMWPRRRQRL